VSSAIYKSRDAIPRADPSYEQIHSSPIHDQSYSDPSYSQSHSSEQYEHDANISSLTEDLAGVSIGSSYEDTQGVKEKRKGNEAADAHYGMEDYVLIDKRKSKYARDR
jgi:hypothetical protein